MDYYDDERSRVIMKILVPVTRKCNRAAAC
jgi:hypothetical protein